LRDVSEPPVWRRVLVPAGTRLGTLAAIIEVAMGWDGLHQHMFSDGGHSLTARGPETSPAASSLMHTDAATVVDVTHANACGPAGRSDLPYG
jgi:hypothetical protein